MKIILASIIALFASSSTFAQITPGSYILGGGVGFGFNQTPGPNGIAVRKSTSFNISPNIGRFVSEKYLIEGGLGFNMFVSTVDNPGTDYYNRQNGYSVNGQFGVTRFIPVKDRLYFTVGANLLQAYSKATGELVAGSISSSSTSSSLITNVGISPGLTYFLNKKWMVYTYVGLLSYQLSYDLDTEQIGHDIYLSARSNSFSVGARYVIGAGTND